MFSSIKNLFGKIFKNKIDINIDINNEISKNELINKLIAADVSPDISNKIIQELSQDLGQKIDQKKFKEIILKLILKKSIPQDKIILLIGINGSGKTTLAAKLMHYLKNKNKKPMLIAGDTFRAAAINQLQAWCLKNNVPLFKSDSKDPAAVVFQGCQAFKDSSNDVLIIDTAGRLQTSGSSASAARRARICLSAASSTARRLAEHVGQHRAIFISRSGRVSSPPQKDSAHAVRRDSSVST